jgi:acyl carrier protein
MYEKLCDIIQSKFQVPSSELRPEVSLSDLGLDSLDMVELSLVIEQELGVRISDDELAEASRVEAIVDLIAGRTASV